MGACTVERGVEKWRGGGEEVERWGKVREDNEMVDFLHFVD